MPVRGFFRSVFYLPYVLPAMAVYLGWAWLYESNFGLFNFVLSGLGFDKVRFIAGSRLVVPSLILRRGAFNIFLISQFVKTILRELDEAATIDGASHFRP